MAVLFPDIMGEYVSDTERFETDNIQYGGHFDPVTVIPGQTTSLYLFLQNTLDGPVKINLQVEVPKTSGFFRGGKPILQVEQTSISLEMGPAEAGLLTLPTITTPHSKVGIYTFILELKATGKGERVRPNQAKSKLDKRLIDDPAGLNLVSSLGATFIAKVVKKATFPITISGEAQEPATSAALQHVYQTMWEKSQLEFFTQALRELELRQNKLKTEITPENLYVALYSESVNRFADIGVPLRVGEAILLAKVLTYSCQYFLSNAARRNGLLIPIWERALDGGLDTSDALQVIRRAGYSHIVKLATAISFNLIAQVVGKHPWSQEERQTVIHHIADNLDTGETTEEDFLYLPLLMGGTIIAKKMILDGENIRHTLALMQKAYQDRPDLFVAPEMGEAKKLYTKILKKVSQTSASATA